MNIYKVVFTGCDYDEYDSFVVAAESAFGAEQLVKDSIPYGESIESITLLGTSEHAFATADLGVFIYKAMYHEFKGVWCEDY